jgi:hypothetical protein
MENKENLNEFKSVRLAAQKDELTQKTKNGK